MVHHAYKIYEKLIIAMTWLFQIILNFRFAVAKKRYIEIFYEFFNCLGIK
jgi:hypothetical protein